MSERTVGINGVIPAIITPFREDGRIDFEALEKQTSYLVGAGASGVFVAGTTGEGSELSTAEKIEVCKTVKATVAEGTKIFAACIQPATRMVIDEMHAFEPLEPDYYVAVTPYYGGVPDHVIHEHFAELADVAPAPLVLYNIPGRTSNVIPLSVIEKMATHPNVVAVKDSSANFMNYSRGLLATGEDGIDWIQGEDYLDAPSLLLGAPAIVTGMGNVWLEPYVAMYTASQSGDSAGVIDAQRKVNHLLSIIDLAQGKVGSAVKAACALQGRCSPFMRTAPLTLGEAETALVRGVVGDLGLV